MATQRRILDVAPAPRKTIARYYNGSARCQDAASETQLEGVRLASDLNVEVSQPLSAPAGLTHSAGINESLQLTASPGSASLTGDANNTAEQASPPSPAHAAAVTNAAHTSLVPNARLLGRINQTEMRVGVASTEFGLIEVRTTVSQDRVGASIETAHSGLHSAIVQEIPSLQQFLERHQLRLDTFNVSTNTGGQGGSSFGEHHARSPFMTQAEMRYSRFSESLTTSMGPASAVIVPYSCRLSVLA